MNFLAHCLLARPGDGYLAGAVLGDFVKGAISGDLPPELQAGIRLHRRIDTHSNQLAEMKRSAGRFHPRLRRAAPVLLDIVADHCLARAWRCFADDDIGAFTAQVYAAIQRFEDFAPPRSRRFVAHMTETDLLARYADPNVAHEAMTRILERLRFAHLTPLLAPALGRTLPRLMADFNGYFPLLRAFATAERARIETAT